MIVQRIETFLLVLLGYIKLRASEIDICFRAVSAVWLVSTEITIGTLKRASAYASWGRGTHVRIRRDAARSVSVQLMRRILIVMNISDHVSNKYD